MDECNKYFNPLEMIFCQPLEDSDFDTDNIVDVLNKLECRHSERLRFEYVDDGQFDYCIYGCPTHPIEDDRAINPNMKDNWTFRPPETAVSSFICPIAMISPCGEFPFMILIPKAKIVTEETSTLVTHYFKFIQVYDNQDFFMVKLNNLDWKNIPILKKYIPIE
jgi:hypothetical protein